MHRDLWGPLGTHVVGEGQRITCAKKTDCWAGLEFSRWGSPAVSGRVGRPTSDVRGAAGPRRRNEGRRATKIPRERCWSELPIGPGASFCCPSPSRKSPVFLPTPRGQVWRLGLYSGWREDDTIPRFGGLYGPRSKRLVGSCGSWCHLLILYLF